MFQLFVAPTAFEGWGEHDYDGTAERQLLAMLIVGLGALALILCVVLLMLFADQPAGPPAQSRLPIPAYLFSFAALRDTRLGRVLINRPLGHCSFCPQKRTFVSAFCSIALAGG